MKKNRFILLILLTLFITGISAQVNIKPIEQAEKKLLIDSITSILSDNYVFPEVGCKYECPGG